jgi:hypothetical protein
LLFLPADFSPFLLAFFLFRHIHRPFFRPVLISLTLFLNSFALSQFCAIFQHHFISRSPLEKAVDLDLLDGNQPRRDREEEGNGTGH